MYALSLNWRVLIYPISQIAKSKPRQSFPLYSIKFIIDIQIAGGTTERSPHSRGNGHLSARTTTVGIVSEREEQEGGGKSSSKTSLTRLKLELSGAHTPRAASDSSVDDLYLHILSSCAHEQKTHGLR